MTVFAIGGAGGVRAVFVAESDESNTGDFALEVGELFEEGAVKIVVTAVIDGVPVVAIPFFGAVDVEWFSPGGFGGVDGN